MITLDTDTQLPRDAARAARRHDGAPAEPPALRRAPQRRAVVEGYGILQPRVGVSLPGASRSRFARLLGGEPGIDPYTRAVSDVYQDLFGEGSFIGKGIYDVDAFERALAGRFPENRILSHDLLEGCYARSGLLSDVQLFEDYPSPYRADVQPPPPLDPRRLADRRLAAAARARAPTGARQRNPLSALSRWKILDNLRRSLVPAALTLLLVLGWTVLPPAVAVDARRCSAILVAARGAARSLLDLLRKPADLPLRPAPRATARRRGAPAAAQALLDARLPARTRRTVSLDAIVRTPWRMLVTRRRLLEWNPSQRRARAARARRLAACDAASMWIAPALALAIAVALL